MIDSPSLHMVDINQYCNDVITFVRPASKKEIQAIKRHLRDLDRQNTPGFPYVFDVKKAEKIINFGELFPHVKGKWARSIGLSNRIKFQPWQKFILASIFGWVHVKTGLRKHRIAYVCIPRKAGKSVLAAVIGLYMLTEDDEYGAEVYCGATSEKQAWEVFRPALRMTEKQVNFRRAYGVTCHARRLETDTTGTKPLADGTKRLADGSRFEPVIGKPGDGASPSCAILDEFHEHDDDVLYDTMLTGMGAREQPLLLAITTAGSNINGPCYLFQKDCEAMLAGSVDDNPELFAIIYTIDTEDEMLTDEGLVKANPNIDISVGREFLQARVSDAINSPRKRGMVLTKHFNIWVHAKEQWLNMADWNACADPELNVNDFAGDTAHLGLDLSESDDLTAVVKCFKREIDGKDHYYFFGRYYATEEKVSQNNVYQEWVLGDHLIETQGSMIDYQEVEDHVKDDADNFAIPQCFFDPHGAANIAQRLEQSLQIEAIKVPQNFTIFSAPMRDFEGLLKEGRIHHDGNPCLTWMMSNVVAKQTDDGKMMRPVKEKREAKIDGAVALLLSFIAAHKPQEDDSLDDFLSNPIIV